MCQLNCPACSIRKYEEKIVNHRKFGYLSFGNFKKLVDDNPQIKKIELSNAGEIFLNPELDEIIKYAYEKKIDLYAYNGVNLNTLPDKFAESVVKYKFKGITVSIDGATPDIYKIYRRGGDFNKVIANIKKINEYKKKYNSKYPKLVYKFIIFNHNIEDIPLAKKIAKELNMEMKFEQNNQPWYAPLSEEQKIRAEKLSGMKFEDTTIENLLRAYKEKKVEWFFCNDLFDSLQIDWNGDLLGCCINIFIPLGKNVFEVGLQNALNSEDVIYVKRMVTDLSVSPKAGIYCSKCDVYNFLKKKNYAIRSDKDWF